MTDEPDAPTYQTSCPHGMGSAVYCFLCMEAYQASKAASATDEDQLDQEEVESENTRLREHLDDRDVTISILRGELAQSGEIIERLEGALKKLRAQIFKSGESTEAQRSGGFARWFGRRGR